MRKHVKEQLYGIFDTISEAHRELGKYILNSDVCNAVDLLTACQSAAISVGNTIEKSEGEGTEAVTLLEIYTEELYKISVTIQDNLSDNVTDKIIMTLNNQINRIMYCVKHDIPEKMEIAFLPYNASMWDSLESVWMAAGEDENCDAYVVPIPYYDKNSDGTLGEMHYDIDNYPDYVPVVSYKDYLIEERKPDVIFIHNPYDGYNRITSVPPQFFSKELKRHTDKLVYIPYFVSGDTVPRHFCVLPGTMYADFVIVENETVRKIYVEEYEKATGKKGTGDKFIALGSPKFDRVARLSREDFVLPDEWRNLIKNRKVILYNTSVQNLLDYTEKVIKKIKNTIDIISKRDDVVLWWRPHPLTEYTLKSMKTDYFDQYMKIVEYYKKSGIGIYDDTADLERAISFSDAYYGDGGSVRVLYEKTGKPVMIQNPCLLG